jgi:hypothetical protein
VMCPYLEADVNHPPKLIRFSSDPSLLFTPPPDPPLPPAPGGGFVQPPPPIQQRVTSLAFNPLVYRGRPLSASIPDGMSMTIAITEHYGFCENAQYKWQNLDTTCFDDVTTMRQVPCDSSSERRATFADAPMFQDVGPVTTEGNKGPVSIGSLPLTFQVQPALNQCDPRVPQSSVPGGIVCGFADGSVRFVGQNVSQAMFWGSVTPDRGEIVSLDF